jgi:phage terminase small subunit
MKGDESMASLTPKQEKFVKSIVLDGMTYSDAYRSAYNTKGMTDKSINEKASRLKDEVKIRARIKELSAEIDSPKIMSVTKRAEKLSEFAECEDPTVAMKAIDLLNKMTGEYIQKVEAEVTREVTINIELSDDDE